MFFYLALTFSALLVIAIGLGSARSAAHSAVESLGSRLLLGLAALNAIVSCLLALFLAAMLIIQQFRAGHFVLASSIATLALLAFPVNIVITALTSQRIIMRRFGLESAVCETLTEQLAIHCQHMEVRPPQLFCSARIQTPFVFGRSARRAGLALPSNWQDLAAPARKAVVLHELAHLRNGDVGLVTGCSLLLQNTRWMIPIALLLVLFSVCLGQRDAQPTRIMLFYLIVFAQLRVLYVIVLRERERLADRVVRLMTDGGEITQALAALTAMARSGIAVAQHPALGWSSSLRWELWLADKAMFSAQQRIWRPMYFLYRFLHATHPGAGERLRILGQSEGPGEKLPNLRLGEAAVLGFAVGTFVAAANLVVFWTAVIDGATTRDLFLRAYTIQNLLGMPLGAFVATLLALPTWSDLSAVRATGRYFYTLSLRWAIAVLFALAASILVLIGGESKIELQLLCALAAAASLEIHLVGICFSIVFVGLWLTQRYQTWRSLQQTLHMARFMAPSFAAVLILVSLAVWQWYPTQTNLAAAAIASALIGIGLGSRANARSRFSAFDRYLHWWFFRWVFSFEAATLSGFRGILLCLIACAPWILTGLASFTILFLCLRHAPAIDGLLLTLFLLMLGVGLVALLTSISRDQPSWLRRVLLLVAILRFLARIFHGFF